MSVIGRIVPSALQHSHLEEAILEPISGQRMDYAIQMLSQCRESSKHYPHKLFIVWSKALLAFTSGKAETVYLAKYQCLRSTKNT